MSCYVAGPDGRYYLSYPLGTIPTANAASLQAAAMSVASASATLSIGAGFSGSAMSVASGSAALTTVPAFVPFAGQARAIGTAQASLTTGTPTNAITIVGASLGNGSGVKMQFRGGNMSGLEFCGVQAQNVSTWGGTIPNWIVYKTWKPTICRIPLHAHSWLGITSYDGSGESTQWQVAPGNTATSANLGVTTSTTNATGTVTPVAKGATSAVIEPYVSIPTGTYNVTFADGTVVVATTSLTFNPNTTHLVWSTPLANAQTSATIVIATPWQFGTGSAVAQFGDGTVRTATVTNGSTEVVWTPALTTNPGTSISLFVWGAARNNDPQGNYRATVIAAIVAAQAQGCAVVLDLHWSAPKFTILGQTQYLTCNNQQPTYANNDCDILFWQSIAAYFGTQATPQAGINNFLIVFELFNEPFIDSYGGTLSAGSADLALLNGGTSTQFPNGSGGPFNIPFTWTLAGSQAMLNAIRATGATNVLLVGGNSYSQQLKNYLVWRPTDTLNPSQVGHSWHPYPNTYNGANNYPYTAYGPYPAIGNDSGYAAPSANDMQYADAVIAAGHCLVITEDGGLGGTSATATPNAEPHMYFMQQWAMTNGVSYIFWQWNHVQGYGTSSTENYGTVYASDGQTIVPIQGEGTTTEAMMVSA